MAAGVRARNQGWVVTTVDALGPAAGKLAVGDRILAIDRDRRAAKIGPELYLWGLGAATNFRISVARKHAIHSFVLTRRVIRDSDALYLSIAELLPTHRTVLLTSATALWYYLFQNVMEMYGGVCNYH